MKNIKYLFLYGLLISLAGCYNSVVRFWNGDGYYPSAAYRKASHECIAEYDKIDIEPRYPLATEESRIQRSKAANWIANCVKNKGI